MTPELPAFFDTMLPFLLGGLPPSEVTARLGRSPSGEARLALYQTLIWRERTSVLRRLFPATRRLANQLEPRLWDRMESRHLVRYRSTCWEPNRVGESFPALVDEWCAVRPTLDVLAEVADYEWLRFLVTVEAGEQVHFRGYKHDVPALVEALERPDVSATPEVTRASVVVAVHRSTSHRAAWTRLGASELAAVARRRGVPLPVPSVSVSEMDVAEEWLTLRGVLPARSG